MKGLGKVIKSKRTYIYYDSISTKEMEDLQRIFKQCLDNIM